MQIGEDKQNRAVGTTLALLERGSRVMSAIHKRLYYAMRQEFRLLHQVFAEYLPPVYPYAVYGGDRLVKLADFSEEVDVIPVADPNVFSLSQRVTLASQQLQIAQSNPQMHDMREAYRRVYEALGTKQIDTLLKPTPVPTPKDPAIENMEALQMQIPRAFPFQNHDAHILAHASFIKSRMVQSNPMVYALLQAHISEHISYKARAVVMAMVMNDENLQKLKQESMEAFQAETESLIALQVAAITKELVEAEGIQQQDPLVALKSRELDLRAMDMQRKTMEEQQDQQRKLYEFESRLDLDKMRREDAEAASAERIRVADEKLDLTERKIENEENKSEG